MEDRIVLRVCQHASDRGVLIRPGPARHVARTIVHRYDRAPDGFVDLELSEEEGIVQASTEILCTSSFLTETLKLHGDLLTLDSDFLDQRRTHAVRYEAKSMQLINNICARESATDVYGEMVLYILHGCGLFEQSTPALYRETMLALESALPRAAIPAFMTQPFDDRVVQLRELWRVVSGLRIYMAATGKPQVGVTDRLATTAAAAAAVISALSSASATAATAFESRAPVAEWIAERAAEESAGAAPAATSASGAGAVAAPAAPSFAALLEDAGIREAIGECVFVAALREAAASLGDRAAALEERRATVAARLQQALEAVHATLGGTATPSKAAVFPLFVHVAAADADLKTIEDEAAHLLHAAGFVKAAATAMGPSVITQSITTDAAAAAALRADAPSPGVGSYRDASPQADWLPVLPGGETLAFNGYCPYAGAQFGVPVKARPEYGVFAVRPRHETGHVSSTGALPLVVYVGVASEVARATVARAAGEFVQPAVATRVGSALMPVLGLAEYLPRGIVQAGLARGAAGGGVARTREAGTQTGQIDPYWDYSYHWNEAELRRLAAKAAALKNCKSRSAQTNRSAYRHDGTAQTVTMKETAQQTAKDAATQPAMYVKGLRGTESSRLETVRFTFEPR